MSRPFLLRLVLASIATALICGAAYVGLGWAVWSRQPRLMTFLGQERFWRLAASYAQAAAILRPGDMDGDGACDGYELFRRTDPRSSLYTPTFGARWDTGGFVADAKLLSNRAEPTWLLNDFACRQPGERRRVAGWLMLDGYPSAFPRGFRLTMIPSRQVLLGPPGGATAAANLDVLVARDGYFTFDVQMPIDAVTENDLPPIKVFITNATTKAPLGAITVRCVWPQPPVAATAKKVPPGDWTSTKRKMGMGEYRSLLVECPLVPDSAQNVIIEAARENEAAEWFPIALCSSNATSSPIRQFITGPFGLYSGPLKFRVIPVRFSPP